MKIITLLFMILAFTSIGYSCNASNQDSPEVKKTIEAPLLLGDPYILCDGDRYYAYGTSADNGIIVYTSDDLKEWEKKGLALNKQDVWGDRWFWAPEVYHIDNKYYMYYSANEHICVATSDSPLGPFKQEIKKPILEEEKSIDNSLFIDDDGTPYLFFVRFNDGNNIWVAEMEKDLCTMKKETMHHCISVSQSWEKIWPRVTEGPFVIKHNNVYYMTYSANNYQSPEYGVGCCTAKSIMGEWTKYNENPILQSPKGLVGVGHHSLFNDKQGNKRIVFHSHNSIDKIHPRVLHIGTYSFEKVNGTDRMRISDKYETPTLLSK